MDARKLRKELENEGGLDKIVRIAEWYDKIDGNVGIKGIVPKKELEEWLKDIKANNLGEKGYRPAEIFAEYSLRILEGTEERGVYVIGAGIGSMVEVRVEGRPYYFEIPVDLRAIIKNKEDGIKIYAENSKGKRIRTYINLRRLGLDEEKDGVYVLIGTGRTDCTYLVPHMCGIPLLYLIASVAPREPKKERPNRIEDLVDIAEGDSGWASKYSHAVILAYRPSKSKDLYIWVPPHAIDSWLEEYVEDLRIGEYLGINQEEKGQIEKGLNETVREYGLKRLIDYSKNTKRL